MSTTLGHSTLTLRKLLVVGLEQLDTKINISIWYHLIIRRALRTHRWLSLPNSWKPVGGPHEAVRSLPWSLPLHPYEDPIPNSKTVKSVSDLKLQQHTEIKQLQHTLNFMDESWYIICPIESRMTFQVILFSLWAVDSTAWRDMS